MKETLQYSHCLNFCFKGAAAKHRPRAQCSLLQRPCLSEHPSCPWSRPNACTQDCLCKQPLTEPDIEYRCSKHEAWWLCIDLSGFSLSTCSPQQPPQAQQQPQAKPQPPARPPPPNLIPQAASSTPINAQPSGPPTNNPPPMAPPSQAQGPPYPTYQGYPGWVFHHNILIF